MTHIQQRRDPAATWASVNPVLYEGEAGHESDTGEWKLGDGVTAWNALPYRSDGMAPLASPTFTGDPKAPTPATSDNDTSIATTAYVKAQLVDTALTGNPTAPTASTADNDTSIATTAFVKAAIALLVDSSPATLDTLNELAAALGDDPNFATTTANALAAKAPLASPALTGNPTAPTPTTTDNDTSIATTAFVKAAARRPACWATAGAVAIADGAFTDVSGMAKIEERGTAITVSGANFTVPEAGWYVITFTVFFSTGSGVRGILIKKNGTAIPRTQANNPAGAEVTLTTRWEGILAASDVIAFQAFQNTGGPLNTISVRASIRSEGPAV